MKSKEAIRKLNDKKQDILSEWGKIDDMLKIHKTNQNFIKTIGKLKRNQIIILNNIYFSWLS